MSIREHHPGHTHGDPQLLDTYRVKFSTSSHVNAVREVINRNQDALRELQEYVLRLEERIRNLEPGLRDGTGTKL